MSEEITAVSASTDLPEIIQNQPIEVRTALEREIVRRVDIVQKDLSEKNEQIIQKALEDFRAAQKPLSRDEIQGLLDQEYATFKIIVRDDPGSDSETTHEFAITELPQSLEKKFYRILKEQLAPIIPKLSGLTDRLLNIPAERQFVEAVEAIEPLMDVASDLVALCLDPRGKKQIDRTWVQEHLSSVRMWSVLRAQVEANKLRDFFSQLSLTSQTTPTALPEASTRE